MKKSVLRSMFCSSSAQNNAESAEFPGNKDWRDVDFTLDFDSKLPVFTEKYIFHTAHPHGAPQTVLLATDRETVSVIVDPNRIGENSGLDWYYPSPDGEYIACGISVNGDEQSCMYVLKTETGENIGKRIPHTSFAHICWLPDSSAFYYSGGKASDFEDAVKYLYLYNIENEAEVSIEDVYLNDPHVMPKISENGRYLVVNTSWEKPCASFYKDRFGDGAWKSFLGDLDGESYGEFKDDNFIVLTTWNAPRGRLLSIPMKTAWDKRTWEEIVPESDAVLQQIKVIDDYLIISELHDACSWIRIKNVKTGKERLVSLPGKGLIESPGSPDSSPFCIDKKTVYFTYSCFTEPARLYSLDIDSGELLALGKEPGYDLSHLTVKQFSSTSDDGEEVPFFLVYRKDLDLTHPNKLLMHGYGGWNINPAPSYIGNGRSCVLPFIEAGGIYSFACIRGGCELGRNWWQNGRRDKKQNTYNDLYAVCEDLIKKGITSSEKLAVIGASNGGLLTAVAATQRPDLFRVVISEVPLTDMIRSLQDPFLSSYKEEYGDPDDAEMFKHLINYSPVHNVKENTSYPAVFILAGKNDVRCQAWNGRKLAALLQDASSSDNPVLLKIMDGGHGPGISTESKLERRTDILTFIMKNLDMEITDLE